VPRSPIDPTPLSLLQRLRRPEDRQAWERFVELYTPLLFVWTRRLGVDGDAAADLVQDVLLLLWQKLPAFAYDPGKRFRGWLWTIVLNKVRDRQRESAGRRETDADLNGFAHADPLVAWAEKEYQNHLVGQAVQIMRSEFEETTWRACWEYVAHRRPAAEVAAELGVSIDVVYQARTRVLRRLRQELDGLLD
jgi:RNA polymerase sigma-70 factor (ECF subfamily)